MKIRHMPSRKIAGNEPLSLLATSYIHDVTITLSHQELAHILVGLSVIKSGYYVTTMTKEFVDSEGYDRMSLEEIDTLIKRLKEKR
jgi:hypothetical protein